MGRGLLLSHTLAVMQLPMFTPSPTVHALIESILVIAIAARTYLERQREPKRVQELDAKLTEKLAPVHAQLLVLEAHVIGPDGENGIRGDVRDIKRRVEGLEERERDRLQHPPYDRRST